MPTWSELETSKGGHEVFDLAGGRGSAGFQIALNAKPRKKGQHYLRNGRGRHPGFLRFDIQREELQQQDSIPGNGPISLLRKDGKFPHRVDGEASLLLPLVKRTILEKRFDVLPAKGLFGEKSSLVLALKVAPKAGQKEIFFVSELGVET